VLARHQYPNIAEGRLTQKVPNVTLREAFSSDG
jgi:hypothetical protein